MKLSVWAKRLRKIIWRTFGKKQSEESPEKD